MGIFHLLISVYMCDIEVNHSIIFICSILDLLSRHFSADREGLGDELLLPPPRAIAGKPTQTGTPHVLLTDFHQCGGLLWFGSQCFAASVSFLLFSVW